VEETGAVGRVSERTIGAYHYDKRLFDGTSVRCAVEVFALEVTEQLVSWPEQAQRQTRWFGLEDAATAVDEAELKAIIRGFKAG